MILGVSNVIAQSPVLTLITADWAPFNYREGKVFKGFSVEVVKAIMEELKVNYKIKLVPGARGELATLVKGDCFVLSGVVLQNLSYK